MSGRAIALALLLSSCATATVRQVPLPVRVAADCPPTPRAPGKLPRLVDVRELRAWADATELAREATVRALRICRARLRETSDAGAN